MTDVLHGVSQRLRKAPGEKSKPCIVSTVRNTLIGILAVVVILRAGAVLALNSLTIFSDSQGSNCLVSDIETGRITLYVIHTTDHATASQFRVVAGDGFNGVFTSHQVAPGFLDLGLPLTDYSVAYANCVVGTFLVVTLEFQGFGTSAACSQISVG